MIRFKEALEPGQIVLDLEAANFPEAIRKLSESLRSDPRVGSLPELTAAWQAKVQGPGVHLNAGVAFVHARTKAVSELVMSFGRLRAPITNCGELIRFILLIGIPKTMDAEYVRLVGALMRVLRDQRLCDAFHEAKRPEEVMAILERGEAAVAS
jgi:mannitol/fructose-specific phosphotransferase system IIA component (Ntr-type)